MKTISKLFYALLVTFLVGSVAFGQTADEMKAAKKGLKGRAYKAARKEAKKLSKEGFVNLPGQLPMANQLERSFALAYALDDKGRNKYFISSQQSKGETFAAAEQQARQICLANIANEIGSNIVGRIKTNLANSESVNDAASVTEVVTAYQNTVAAKLGRTKPVALFKREEKGTGLTYVYMTMAYDYSAAEEMVKDDLRTELKEKTEMLQEEIDKILNLDI